MQWKGYWRRLALKGKGQLTGQDIETGPRLWTAAKHSDITVHSDVAHVDSTSHSDAPNKTHTDHSDHSDVPHSDTSAHSDHARFR